MNPLKMIYALCGLVVVAVVGLALVERGPAFATDCSSCAPKFCGWYTQPLATNANSSGHFDTATDGDPNELTISWCFADGNPIAGSFSFDSSGSTNISGTPTYTPSSFQIFDCVGDKKVTVSGNLNNHSADGTVSTKAQIGAFPGCNATKSLTVNHG
jgi:hypothetical protein